MRVEKVDNIKVSEFTTVKVKEMGNVVEIMYREHVNSAARIIKIDKDNYVVVSTGEICQFNHIENRSQDKQSLCKTLRRLRDILNTNIVDVDNCRWVTLTYAENMTDTKRLYTDFEKFNKRMLYWENKHGISKHEYIVACEPQGRGAWHCHIVFIYPEKAPFIPNDELKTLWGHGFVTIKALDDVDNVGAYLTAYLGDMDVQDALQEGKMFSGDKVKEVSYIDGDGNQKSKYYVKGARLHMYPPKFNLYRKSKGIKEPVVYEEINGVAMKKVSSGKLTYEKTIKLIDEVSDFYNTINYKYYNTKRESVSIVSL